jgi:competence protein ComEC
MPSRWWRRLLPVAPVPSLVLAAFFWGVCHRPAIAFAAAPQPATTSRMRVDFIDVGHGDAILITSPAGKTVLIDGGLPEAGQRVAAFVQARSKMPLDLVVLTHRHADHLGGLAVVVARQGARAFMDAPFPHPSPAYDNLLRVLEDRHVPIREAQRGREIDLGGGARLVLLTPPAPLITGSRSDVNANSVVARLELGHVRMLLTGDAEAVTEDWLLDSKVDLRADVLKLAHHGGKYSSTARFLRAVSPRIAVASAGPGERSGTLQPETAARVEKGGARLYRTDQDGNITVWTDGREVQVVTQHRREHASAEAVR